MTTSETTKQIIRFYGSFVPFYPILYNNLLCERIPIRILNDSYQQVNLFKINRLPVILVDYGDYYVFINLIRFTDFLKS